MTSHRWKKFFVESGLPSDVSDNYVVVFMENRIRFDMLSELNKEILYDMGIRKIGDVISILRHAKEVHNNTSREKVFANDTSEPMDTDSSRIKSKLSLTTSTTNSTPVTKTTRVIIPSQSCQLKTNHLSLENVGTRTVQSVRNEPVIIRNVTGLNTRKRIEPPSDELPRAKLSRVGLSTSATSVTVRNRIEAQSRMNNFSKEIYKAISSNMTSTTSTTNNTNSAPLRPNQANTSNNKPSVTVSRNLVVSNKPSIKSRLGKADVKERLGTQKQTVFERISTNNKTSDSVFNRLGAR